jgi:hypothetical protein
LLRGSVAAEFKKKYEEEEYISSGSGCSGFVCRCSSVVSAFGSRSLPVFVLGWHPLRFAGSSAARALRAVPVAYSPSFVRVSRGSLPCAAGAPGRGLAPPLRPCARWVSPLLRLVGSAGHRAGRLLGLCSALVLGARCFRRFVLSCAFSWLRVPSFHPSAFSLYPFPPHGAAGV